MDRSTAQIIEAFHLSFLAVLRTRLEEDRYVLKGGANLRYFFGSVRYSEDIDLDVRGVADDRFAERIDKVFAAQTLTTILRARGLRVRLGDGETGRTKQTATTRRWRVLLDAPEEREPVRTKVEFSARNGEKRIALDTVPDHVVQQHGMSPPAVQHYELEPATEQKAAALAGRPQTQARDVFDLDLLLRKQPLTAGAVGARVRTQAAEAAIELPYSAFQDQVIPFLDPDVAALYDGRAWQTMQHFVAGELLR